MGQRFSLLGALVVCVGCGDAGHKPATRAPDPADAAPADAAMPVPTDDAQAAPISCTGRPPREGDSVITVTVAGSAREARVHVPKAYDPTHPTPLVLNFHGSSSNAVQQEAFAGLIAKADAAGFVLVHPEGLEGSWNAGTCCEPALMNQVDDVAFVSALLDALEAELCIAPKQVFATGMSNGAEMAHRLACELATRIAAIAPVAGGDLTKSCKPARPVSVLAFHGTADTDVPYDGDTDHPAIAQTIADWAMRDGCTGKAVETFSRGDSHCETHSTCDAGVEVTLCTIEDGGHTWPGGADISFLGKTTHDLKANNAMWDFFQRHPLP